MRFIHTADLHLGLTLKTASFKQVKAHTQRVHEITESFYRLLEVVEKQAIPLLFIAGDFFDHDQLSLSRIETFFNKLKASSAEVFIVFGNHDTFLRNPVYQPMMQGPNIHVLTPASEVHRLDTIDIIGMSTHDFSLERLNAMAFDANKNTVLILHGDLTNPKDNHYLTDVNTLKQLPVDYIALGHQHKHEFLAPHIAYSGNLEPFDFSESGNKGYILGDLETKTYTFKPFNQRHFHTHTIDLTTSDTLSEIKQSIMQSVDTKSRTNDFNRLVLTGTYDLSNPPDIIQLKQLLEDDFYYCEIINNLKPAYDLTQLKTMYQDTIIETIIDQHDHSKSDSDSVHLAISALLETVVKS